MKLKSAYAGCLVLVLALLSGCASVPMASSEADAQAKTFAVKPGKANIYVYRHETMGAAIPMTVSLNGRVVGQTASKTYFLFEVDPGNYEVTSHTENVDTLRLAAAAGRNYYVWQEVKMGLGSARSQLRQVDEATGRKDLAECKLIQSKL
jgi:hypothetical protein